MMLLIFLVIAAQSCNFQTAFQSGAQSVNVERESLQVEDYCFGATEENKRDFLLAYEAGRQHSETLKQAAIKVVPANVEELEDLLAKADRVLKMQALRDEVAEREGRIQNLKKQMDRNEMILQSPEAQPTKK